MKQKIVLLGAFDRYNYGDNLLPILFELYLQTHARSVLERYDLRYCAITASDLSKYGAKATTSLKDEILHENVHSIIAMGGEILAATSSVLFLHNSPPATMHAAVDFLQSHGMKRVADLLCRKLLGLPWEFPYIPVRVDPKTRIALNTVGGKLPSSAGTRKRHKLAARLRGADYISVRDRRTLRSVELVVPANLYPDSAVTMGALVTDPLLVSNIGVRTRTQLSRKYLCFQAAPAKAGCTVTECIEALRKIVSASGFDLLLLPIGYASGHDDQQFLSRIHSDHRLESTLLPDLNIWETMALIRNSQAFIGTSLHGCITAMSFGVPYVGINPKVSKLQSFLQDWATPPLDTCFRMSEAAGALEMALRIDRWRLLENADHLHAAGLKNYSNLLASIGLTDGVRTARAAVSEAEQNVR